VQNLAFISSSNGTPILMRMELDEDIAIAQGMEISLHLQYINHRIKKEGFFPASPPPLGCSLGSISLG